MVRRERLWPVVRGTQEPDQILAKKEWDIQHLSSPDGEVKISTPRRGERGRVGQSVRLAHGAKDVPDRELNGRNGYWLVACLGTKNRHLPVVVAGVERKGAECSVMEAETGIHASELPCHGGT